MRDYFSITYLERELKKGQSLIYKSLGKYGYSSFKLEILEYCDPSEAIEREQYYLNQLKPEYNILKTAGSSLGFKHSDETKKQMRAKALTSERLEQLNHLNANTEFQAKRLERLNRIHQNPEIQAKRLAALKISNSSPEHQAKRLENLNRLHQNPEYQAQRLEHLNHLHSIQSHQVFVLDTLTNETIVYSSINEAARAIEVSKDTIGNAFRRKGESSV